MTTDKLFGFELLAREVGKEVNKNILNGNDYFEILFKNSPKLEKNIKKLKQYFKKIQVQYHMTKEKEHLILAINFQGSPAIKLLRKIYGIN